MIPLSFLEELRCPYSGSRLFVERVLSGEDGFITAGIVASDCFRYPIVDGILVLLPGGERVVEQLENGAERRALQFALYDFLPANARTRRRRTVDFIEGLHLPLTQAAISREPERACGRVPSSRHSFHAAARILRHRHYADYLVHRFANPSFLAGIAAISTLHHLRSRSRRARSAVLDLACGTGLSSYLIRRFFPDFQVVASDHDFVNLYLGNRYFGRDVVYVCADSQTLLPYADDSIDAVFCLDALHYLASKALVVSELDRVMRSDGMWLFPHLHNKLRRNPTPGVPLAPDGYTRLFRNQKGRLYAEDAIVSDLFNHGRVDLAATSTTLDDSDALFLAACRDDAAFSAYPSVLSSIQPGSDSVAWNPIYRIDEAGDHVTLYHAWPNERLRAECEGIREYVPDRVSIDRTFWTRFNGGRLASDDAATFRELVRACVLVPLPSELVASSRPSEATDRPTSIAVSACRHRNVDGRRVASPRRRPCTRAIFDTGPTSDRTPTSPHAS